ncbi:hypothetical protein ABG768_027949 [Culter alburnus]|uniref:Uncharacterized protein n=1 Tax=Culter alburnus TaxID=194366 RepID=A0AAW2AB61_CULAL
MGQSGPERRAQRSCGALRCGTVGFNTVFLLIIFITHQSENSTTATLNTLCPVGKKHTYKRSPTQTSPGREQHGSENTLTCISKAISGPLNIQSLTHTGIFFYKPQQGLQ